MELLLDHEPEMRDLFDLLAKYGGKIISSNDLHHDLVAQARASNRMYVDKIAWEGYVWEPVFANRFPTTEKEVIMFEQCYPIDPEISEAEVERMFHKILRHKSFRKNNEI